MKAERAKKPVLCTVRMRPATEAEAIRIDAALRAVIAQMARQCVGNSEVQPSDKEKINEGPQEIP